MNVLVVGSGGREHALVWKISQSPEVDEVFCAPGNAGIAKHAECVDIGSTEIARLRRLAIDRDVELTVVGPEEPLCAGIVDSFRSRGLKIFGPTQRAAKLEGSKVFAKELMRRHAIPTARFRVFNSAERANNYVDTAGAPLVVKADGLAGGKAAFVCGTEAEAHTAIKRIMVEREFGDSGDQIVIEECLKGEEASMLAFTDGTTIVPLPSSQDHKPVWDGDRGPNTGGMGAYSPAPVITPERESTVERDVLVQAVHAMHLEERPYSGVLYAGLMITRDGPQVLEFNCRLGDPELQPLVMRLKSDLVPLLMATVERRLDEVEVVVWHSRPSLCVIMASGGYPRNYKKGYPIEGLEDVEKMEDVEVFHSGTAMEDGHVVTDGGRVLGVTARGDTIADARDRAYLAVKKISFQDAHYRTDIGQKAIDREETE